MRSIGPGVNEIRIHTETEHRIIYLAKFSEAIYVLHAFKKKSRKGIETPKHEIDVIKARLRMAAAHYRQNYGKGGEK